MTGFSPTWLDLREPFDTAARASYLIELLRSEHAASGTLHVLDMACGTGANLRYLVPRLGGVQEWTLVDNDPVLLNALPQRLKAWATGVGAQYRIDRRQTIQIIAPDFECHIRSRQLDLVTELDQLETSTVQLVTASALLDLVSPEWLHELAGFCQRHNAGVLFALNYDGRIAIEPADPIDERLRELVNQHQRTDKGFGPALGPECVLAVEQLYSGLGYHLQLQPSDWHIDAGHPSLQQMLVQGWLDAAVEMAPREGSELRAWGHRRSRQIEITGLQITVGHADIAGWLA